MVRAFRDFDGDGSALFPKRRGKPREMRGEIVECVSSVRAPMIGRIGLATLAEGRFTDALALDANYVATAGRGDFLEREPGAWPLRQSASRWAERSGRFCRDACGDGDFEGLSRSLAMDRVGLKELMGWRGVLALVSEATRKSLVSSSGGSGGRGRDPESRRHCGEATKR